MTTIQPAAPRSNGELHPETDYAALFLSALGGAPVHDFRAIHDQDKARSAVPLRGPLDQCRADLNKWNQAGYGIFVCIGEMDGNGREAANVVSNRAHYIDADKPEAAQFTFDFLSEWTVRPTFRVNTSFGKYHYYWKLNPQYRDNDRFKLVQRKLVTMFGSDPKVVAATHVMRAPGFWHLKNPTAPHLVTYEAMGGLPTSIDALDAALGPIVLGAQSGGRHPLGDLALAAPSLALAVQALYMVDPNNLDRGEWIAHSSAFKQMVSTLCTPEVARWIWDMWCARYEKNDTGENIKQWNSIRSTEVGWRFFTYKFPTLLAPAAFGDASAPRPAVPTLDSPSVPQRWPLAPTGAAGTLNPSARRDATLGVAPRGGAADGDDILTPAEQQRYFADCFYVSQLGAIFTPNGAMGPGDFNARYGGKLFIITKDGKVTDEPWKAATRSLVWTIPKVDRIRFMPSEPFGAIITDQSGRKGGNTYRPAIIATRPGDPSPFLDHLALLIPQEADRKIILDFMAHNAKFPGHKIPWAILIQSGEGAGKGVIKQALQHVMGEHFVYEPKADQLSEGGGKFNAWMRNRLMIIVDEIKTDDRRDLIELLKPMITELRIEIQGKGENQAMEDNPANWVFFSNYKNAIPITRDSRRYAIFYSAIQSADDLQAFRMDKSYFDRIYHWLDYHGGREIVAYYLLNYPIERGALSGRAPITSSTDEAREQSQGPLEAAITEVVADGRAGFRGGWISTVAITNLLRETGMKQPHPRTVGMALASLGYHHLGRSGRLYPQESMTTRTHLWNTNDNANIENYGPDQGYLP